jgi:hypothetical protein
MSAKLLLALTSRAVLASESCGTPHFTKSRSPTNPVLSSWGSIGTHGQILDFSKVCQLKEEQVVYKQG